MFPAPNSIITDASSIYIMVGHSFSSIIIITYFHVLISYYHNNKLPDTDFEACEPTEVPLKDFTIDKTK